MRPMAVIDVRRGFLNPQQETTPAMSLAVVAAFTGICFAGAIAALAFAFSR